MCIYINFFSILSVFLPCPSIFEGKQKISNKWSKIFSCLFIFSNNFFSTYFQLWLLSLSASSKNWESTKMQQTVQTLITSFDSLKFNLKSNLIWILKLNFRVASLLFFQILSLTSILDKNIARHCFFKKNLCNLINTTKNPFQKTAPMCLSRPNHGRIHGTK